MKEVIRYNLNEEIRLDKYLQNEITDLSRTKIQKFIEDGIIKVDNFIVKPSYKLKKFQIISINKDNIEAKETYLSPQKMNLNIIYEVDSILVIDKEPGIVVHPGIGNKDKTLLNGVLHYTSKLSNMNNRPGVIHRLDKETSGIIVFAKTDKAHYNISEQFANRTINKKYLAAIWGNFNGSIKINGYLKRDPKNRLKFKLFNDNGKYSSSSVSLYSAYSIPISIVDVFPKTGRTHQIRVHMASIGQPILKDDLYNGSDKMINSFHQKYRLKLEKAVKSINWIIGKNLV